MTRESLFAVVLAAGRAQRFGHAKQLARLSGQTLVERAVRLAEAVCGRNTVLVVGNDALRVAAACAPLQGFLTCNEDYAAGIGGSIATGIGALGQSASGALLILADQPLVRIDDLQRLISCWNSAPGSIVASSYAETCGPPVIFPKTDFATLRQLSGDRGARSLLRANRQRLSTVACERAAIDIDEPKDLQRIQEAARSGC